MKTNPTPQAIEPTTEQIEKAEALLTQFIVGEQGYDPPQTENEKRCHRELAYRIAQLQVDGFTRGRADAFAQAGEVVDGEVARMRSIPAPTNYAEAIAAAQKIVEAANSDLIADLERRLRLASGGGWPCAQCGGPHDFDTSLPSVVWNQVIRAKGLPEYLCTTCIVREFVRAGQSFTAQLYNEEFYGTSIEVRVNGQVANDAALISDENTSFRVEIEQLTTRIAELERERDAAKGRLLDETMKVLRAADIHFRTKSQIVNLVEAKRMFHASLSSSADRRAVQLYAALATEIASMELAPEELKP